MTGTALGQRPATHLFQTNSLQSIIQMVKEITSLGNVMLVNTFVTEELR